MSNLSELLPAGAGAKSADFVASGTLGSGVTVALNSDGTVTAIASDAAIGGIDPPTAETAVQVFPNSVTRTTTYYDAVNNKVVVSYKGNSSYGTTSIGSISGSTITFGTPVVWLSEYVDPLAVVYIPSTSTCVLAIETNSGNQVTVGTVSGSSFSIGTRYAYNGPNTNSNVMVYDPDQNKVVHAFNDYEVPSNNYGTLRVYTVSGTSISLGSKIVFASTSVYVQGIAYDTENNKVVIAYEDQNDSQKGRAIVATISGSSASFGSAVYYESTGVANPASLTYDPVAKKIAFFWRSGTANANKGAVATVSGTSISFGTAVTFYTPGTLYVSSVYVPDSGDIIVANEQYMRTATISGTSISFGTQTTYRGTAVRTSNMVYDTAADKVVIVNRIDSIDVDATVVNVVEPASNNTDFIGITDQAIADTATGAVIVQGGVSEKLSGLTIGADYYVQDDGSLASGSIPYDISSASFVQSFSVSAQETAPHGVAFNTDGTKMFIVGSTGDDVNEYALSTVFDVSTASFTQNFSVASQENGPYAIAFNTNGTKMFILGVGGDDVNEYTLSTGFDISTASFVDSFSVSAQDTLPLALAFSTDGTKMFVVGATGVDVNEYTLSTGFDVSTASFVVSFSVSSQDTGPAGIAFNNDGTQMFISGQTADSIHKYTLTTGFSVSTASFLNSFSVASQDSSPRGLAFSANGTKMFVVGGAGVDVNEYATTAASTTVPAGRALSTTSILLEG